MGLVITPCKQFTDFALHGELSSQFFVAMAKTESTALIDLVQTATPLKPNPADDLMFAPPPSAPAPSKKPPRVTQPPPASVPLSRARSAAGSQSVPNMPIGNVNQVRVSAAPVRAMSIPPITTAPPLPNPSARPSLPPPIRSQGTPAPELFARTTPSRPAAPASMPIAAPFEPRMPVTPSHADMTSSQPWFDAHQTSQQELEDAEVVSTIDGTHPVGKQATGKLVGKLILPTVGLVVIGVLVGGFIAFDGAGGKSKSAVKPLATQKVVETVAPAPVAVAAVAPAPPVAAEPVAAVVATAPEVVAPEPAPAPAPPGVVAFVDVRIDSTPSGATVMLVDKGKTTFLGTTPISTSLDPAHGYDVVFAYESQPTQIEHLEPSVTTHMSIALGKPPAAVKAVAVVAPAPAPAPRPAAAPVEKAIPAPKKIAPAAPAPAVVEAAVPKAGGEGTLMIASKPPCEIYVDGKATGLITPQRTIALAAGAHKITLIGATDKTIKKTVAIQIVANQPTKVIQDLMATP